MRPVSAATPVLVAIALLLSGIGGQEASAGAQELRQPPRDARWQYQLESANRGLASSGAGAGFSGVTETS